MKWRLTLQGTLPVSGKLIANSTVISANHNATQTRHAPLVQGTGVRLLTERCVSYEKLGSPKSAKQQKSENIHMGRGRLYCQHYDYCRFFCGRAPSEVRGTTRDIVPAKCQVQQLGRADALNVRK